ncbi:DNA polymerase [Labrenzia sp. EL_208]|nr:DNA polymerase [Labrenzia sp. EL_132]MBG6227127.1 DNA polymerase [Labrenzia sp. EL_208]
MTNFVEIDFETRGVLDIKKVGAYRYLWDRYTQVMMASYKINNGLMKRWFRGQPCPQDLVEAIEAGYIIFAHNATFERLVFWLKLHKLPERLKWPKPKLEQFRCTARIAAALSLPRSLEKLCNALDLEVQKDMDGSRLMLKLAKPRKIWSPEEHGHKRYPDIVQLFDDLTYTEMEDGRVIEWWSDDADLSREHDYCDTDVDAQQQARLTMLTLQATEWETYWLTERMNDRGVPLDMNFVRSLKKIADSALEDLDAEMNEVTGEVVTKCSQVAKIREYLYDTHGFKLPDLAKDTLTKQLERHDLPNSVRVILELRQQAAKASTAKLDAMERCQINGRVYGVHLCHGAGTGRWSGRLVQTQNMPRGTGVIENPEDAEEDILEGNAERIRTKYGNPLFAVSDCLRACITAPTGHELYVADFASIEGRVTAWLAGEEWKLEAFRKADRGEGPGMYEVAAAGIYACRPEDIGKKSPERQTGKVAELALGFQGGVRAFHSMAKVYNVDMSVAFEPLIESSPAGMVDKAQKLYTELHGQFRERLQKALLRGLDQNEALDEALNSVDIDDVDEKEADKLAGGQARGVNLMSREAWIASELTKVKWREQHTATKELWYGLENAAIDAVRNPGTVFSYGFISYVFKRGFLWARLPSGRALAYGAPRLRKNPKPWNPEEYSWGLTAMTLDSTTGRWVRRSLYGGLLTENVVQAVARDLMRYGLIQTEKAGFENVMTVHDEGVAVVPVGRNEIDRYCELLAKLPEWARDLPVVAAGFIAKRYKKD